MHGALQYPLRRGLTKPRQPVLDLRHPLSRGLIGCWPLNGEGATIFPDIAGSQYGEARTGGQVSHSFTNTFSQLPSHHGGVAPKLNGVNDNGHFIIVGGDPGPLQYRTFSRLTVALWVYPTSLSDGQCMISYGREQGEIFLITMGQITANKISFGSYYETGATWVVAEGNSSLFTANAWNHVAGTYDGTNLRLYVNGNFISQTALSSITSASTIKALLFGAYNYLAGGVAQWGGGLEGVRLYNRAIPDEDILRLYSDPYAGIVDAANSFQIVNGLYVNIDEVTTSDADFILSGVNPTNDIVIFTLSNPPAGKRLRDPFIVRYRYKKTDTTAINIVVTLRQGTTQISQWTHTGATTSFQTAEQTVTGSEYAAITDWNDLRLEFKASLP